MPKPFKRLPVISQETMEWYYAHDPMGIDHKSKTPQKVAWSTFKKNFHARLRTDEHFVAAVLNRELLYWTEQYNMSVKLKRRPIPVDDKALVRLTPTLKQLATLKYKVGRLIKSRERENGTQES